MILNFYTDNDKIIVIEFCKNKIQGNGYVRLGWAVKESIPNKEFNGDGHRKAFLNSVSAMLVNSGQYVREENEEIHGDYDILLNSSFFLNESIISTNKVTRLIAYIAVTISLITLGKDFIKSDKVQIPQLQQTNKQLEKQQILMDSLVQKLKYINYSLQIMVQDSLGNK